MLEQVIKRSREGYWKPAGATAEDERLLAVATMAGGMAIGALDRVTERLVPSWDIDRHPAMFLVMTGHEPEEIIAPLEPNIVGEHFALACLAQKNLSGANRTRLCDLAWQFNPLGMAQFVLRAIHDFRLHDPAAARPLVDGMREAAAGRDEAAAWELWALATTVSIGGDLLSLVQNSVLAQPTGAQTGSSAKMGFFYENVLVSRDPVAARALLDGIHDVAVSRNETSLWKVWTYAALTLIDDLVSRDPVAAWTLLDEVLGVTASRHGEDFMWSAFVGNIANAAASGWLDNTRAVAAARGEARLWEQWADAALQRMHFLGSRDPAAARALLDDMRQAAEARNEAFLWEWWAMSSFALIVDLGSRDPAASRALVADMLKAVERHPGDVGGWQTKVVGLVLHAAFSLTGDLASRDPDAARAFCTDVLGLPEWMLHKMQFGG